MIISIRESSGSITIKSLQLFEDALTALNGEKNSPRIYDVLSRLSLVVDESIHQREGLYASLKSGEAVKVINEEYKPHPSFFSA